MSDPKEKSLMMDVIRSGHLAETAIKIRMLKEGFAMIRRGCSPHMMAIALVQSC